MIPPVVHPEWIGPLAEGGAALVALVMASFALARRRAARLLGAPGVVGWAVFARDAVLLGAVAATAAALLGPLAGVRTVLAPASGIDVVLLLDVSRSMDARDVPPSRLARARALATALLGHLEPGDRAALAAFAGRGVLLTPLSPDHDALSEMVDAFDTDLIEPGGSALGDGVRAALDAFEDASQRPRVVVVLGDGEDPESAAESGAAAARRAGARVVTVALGGEAGATVPDDGAPLRDAGGRIVVSRRDAARLAALAAATGGDPFVADRFGELDLDALRAAVRRDAGRTGGGLVARRVPATASTACAALAFALALGEWVAAAAGRRRGPAGARLPRRAAGGGRRRGSTPVRVAVGAAGLAMAAAALALGAGAAAPAVPDAVLAPLEAELRAHPGDPALLVTLGVARAQAGQPDEAARALRAAAVSASAPTDASLAWYDLGVLELGRRRLEPARDAFLEALALAPDDVQARFDLEWTLRALRTAPPPKPAAQAGKEDSERDPRPAPGAKVPPAPRPEAGRAPAPDRARPASSAPTPVLSPQRARYWLEQVGDDPGRALRAHTRGGGEPRRERASLRGW